MRAKDKLSTAIYKKLDAFALNTGMSYSALAVWEEMPEFTRIIVDRAVGFIRLPMGEYAPDGAYPEGYGYWGYGTNFNVMFISAIEKLSKTDYGLSQQPGFMQTAVYLENMTGSSKMCYNYADCGAGDLLPQHMITMHPTSEPH